MAANQADNTAERFVEEWLQQGKATRTAAEAAQARAERIEYAKERMEASPSVMRVPIGSQFHAKDRSRCRSGRPPRRCTGLLKQEGGITVPPYRVGTL